MSFTIRGAAGRDRTQWQALWVGYVAFYEADVSTDVTDTTWARFHDPAEPMFCLVAEDDETHELLGFVHCILHRGTWAIEDFCYLEDLFTAETARKRGVGRALIEAVYQRADELKCSRVYWLTHETNTTARKLYEQVAQNLGFIQYRR